MNADVMADVVRDLEKSRIWQWRLASYNAERQRRGEVPLTMRQFLECLANEFDQEFRKCNAKRARKGMAPVTEDEFRNLIWFAVAKARLASSRDSDRPH
jgi:hypothetical protein